MEDHWNYANDYQEIYPIKSLRLPRANTHTSIGHTYYYHYFNTEVEAIEFLKNYKR